MVLEGLGAFNVTIGCSTKNWYYRGMAKNTSVTLGQHYEHFIAQMVESGRYATSSEVIRAGLRMIEDYERRVEILRHELQKGEESGFVEDFDFNEFIEKMKRGDDVSA